MPSLLTMPPRAEPGPNYAGATSIDRVYFFKHLVYKVVGDTECWVTRISNQMKSGVVVTYDFQAITIEEYGRVALIYGEDALHIVPHQWILKGG